MLHGPVILILLVYFIIIVVFLTILWRIVSALDLIGRYLLEIVRELKKLSSDSSERKEK